MPIDRLFGRAAPPPPSAPPSHSSSDKKPIGVPEDYSTVVPNQSLEDYYGHEMVRNDPYGKTKVGPHYFEGDQYMPGGGSPEAIAELQRDMLKAGLIKSSTNIRLGVFDDATRKAYEELLATSNARGLDANTTLNDMVAAPQTNPGGSGSVYQAPPLQLKTTNKDDLKQVFRGAVIDKLGEGWTQGQINELVDAYNWKEIQVQRDAYNQQVELDKAVFEGGPGGGMIVQPSMPSPETFIDEEMRKKDPVGYQAGQVTNELIPQVFQNLEGWV